MSFPTKIGQTYRVERSDSLNPVNWLTVSNNISATGGLIQIPDAFNPDGQDFYRIVVLVP